MDSRWFVGGEYSDHVEAHFGEIRLRFSYISFGESTDGPLFARGDGFERMAVSRASTQLDLDEDECFAVAHDQVYLPFTGAIVSLDEAVSPPEKVTQSKVLAPVTGLLRAQATTPA